MAHESFTIEIDGEEMNDLYPDLIDLEVELDNELASMFRLRLAMTLRPDGKWTWLDDERLMIWKTVTINAGFMGGMQEVISGYITHVRPIFDSDLTRCALEIWGMDGSVRMDQQEKLKAWPDKTDSDIASEIFGEYQLTAEVTPTEVVHDQAVSTIIQRETDARFLSRLALRNGFECYVEGSTGYFGPPQLDATPQPILAIHFGDQTNLNAFAIEVNALTASSVAIAQVGRFDKQILETAAESSQQTVLGAADAGSLTSSEVDGAKVYLDATVTTGIPEMTELCQGLYHRAEWFVTGEGEVSGNHYEHVLKPRRTVTIKGVGEAYSGVYYVTHVTHTFTPNGYTQTFRVKRNALMPTGTEDFSASIGF